MKHLLNPEDYVIVDYLDNSAPVYYGQPDWEAEISAWKGAIKKYFPTSLAIGYEGPQLEEDNIYRCYHCGQTNVRYICVAKHLHSGRCVVIGDVCAEQLNFNSFEKLKAATVREKAKLNRIRLKFLEKHPKFKDAYKASKTLKFEEKSAFLKSTAMKFEQYGEISERRAELFVKIVEQLIDKKELPSAPSGLQTVYGTVSKYKYVHGYFGVQKKMLIQLDNGACVLSTVPKNLLDKELIGKRVKLTATFYPGRAYESFAFASRPKVELEPDAQMVAAEADKNNA